MDLVPAVKDFEYTIRDSNGIRGFKDGKEYTISEVDYKKAHPLHQDSGCKECDFASNLDTIFLHLIPRDLREQATKKPTFVGLFHMPGWTGHSGFYLFKCQSCNAVDVDYPHGYTNGGCLYLRCNLCRYQLIIHPRKNREYFITRLSEGENRNPHRFRRFERPHR